MDNKMLETKIENLMAIKSNFSHGTEYALKQYNMKSFEDGDNIILVRENLKGVYANLFNEALKVYNSTGHRVRYPIEDYYKHIKNGKQERLFYRFTMQIGDNSDCQVGTVECDIVVKIFKEYAKEFSERNSNFKLFDAVIYLDSATPYLAVNFVPFATNQTRGLPTKNSLRQAFAQQGYSSKSRTLSETYYWCAEQLSLITRIAKHYKLDLFVETDEKNVYKSEEYIKATEEFARINKYIEDFDNIVNAKKIEIKQLENIIKDKEDIIDLVAQAKEIKLDIDDIKPQKTLMNSVKGITIEQIENLKLLAIQNEELRKKEEILIKENGRLQLEKIELQNKSLDIVEQIQNVFQENKKVLYDKVLADESVKLERDFSTQLLKSMTLLVDYKKEELPENYQELIKQVRSDTQLLVTYYEDEKSQQESEKIANQIK